MMRLVKDLQRQPERAERTLSTFQAELMDDAERLQHEAQHNSFEGMRKRAAVAAKGMNPGSCELELGPVRRGRPAELDGTPMSELLP